MWLVFLAHPNETMDSQVIRERGRVMTRWEVRENDCGYKAVMFISRIVVKISRRLMFCLLFFFRLKEISFLMNREILFLTSDVGFVNFHVFKGFIMIIKKSIIQEADRKEEDGSKIEKRFVIILFFWWGIVFWWGRGGRSLWVGLGFLLL